MEAGLNIKQRSRNAKGGADRAWTDLVFGSNSQLGLAGLCRMKMLINS